MEVGEQHAFALPRVGPVLRPTKDGKLAIKLQIGEKRAGQMKNNFLGAGNQRCFRSKFRFLNQLYSPKPRADKCLASLTDRHYSSGRKLTRITLVL